MFSEEVNHLGVFLVLFYFLSVWCMSFCTSRNSDILDNTCEQIMDTCRLADVAANASFRPTAGLEPRAWSLHRIQHNPVVYLLE